MINPDEIIYVVDENNNPIEPLPRKIAHKNNAWHRTTVIWVINNSKQILCQRRSMKKDQNPGKWDAYFGGHIEQNEYPTESATREVSEELGQVVTPDQLIPFSHPVKSDKPTHKEFQYVFAIFINGESEKFKFELEEIDELKWIELDNVKKSMLETKDENWVLKIWDQEVLDWVTSLTPAEK